MAITDNTFTPEEISAAIEANPDLLPVLTGTLTAKEYTVYDKTSKEAYDTNFRSNLETELTPTIKTAAMQEFEDAQFAEVAAITGLKRNSDESLVDFQKRGLKSDITDAERQQLQSLKDNKTKLDTEITQLKDQHQTEIVKLRAENAIFGQISKVDAKLKKDPLLQDAIEIVKTNVIENMIKSARFEKDKTDATKTKMVFFGPDNKALINPTTQEFMSAEEVYAQKMDKYLDKAPVKTGANGGPDGPEEQIAPGNIKTQLDLARLLEARGLIAGTTQYTSEWNRLKGATLPPQ